MEYARFSIVSYLRANDRPSTMVFNSNNYNYLRSLSTDQCCFYVSNSRSVLAIQGTNFSDGKRNAIKDMIADIDIFVDKVTASRRYKEYEETLKKVIKYCEEQKIYLELVGHSLGARLIIESMYNGYGMLEILKNAYCFNTGSTFVGSMTRGMQTVGCTLIGNRWFDVCKVKQKIHLFVNKHDLISIFSLADSSNVTWGNNGIHGIDNWLKSSL